MTHPLLLPTYTPQSQYCSAYINEQQNKKDISVSFLGIWELAVQNCGLVGMWPSLSLWTDFFQTKLINERWRKIPPNVQNCGKVTRKLMLQRSVVCKCHNRQTHARMRSVCWLFSAWWWNLMLSLPVNLMLEDMKNIHMRNLQMATRAALDSNYTTHYIQIQAFAFLKDSL